MTIAAWTIPTGLTAIVFAWAIMMPMPASSDYGLEGTFSALFRLAVCIIFPLIFWLVYFMAKSAS